MEMNVIQKIFPGYESVIVVDSQKQCCTDSIKDFTKNFLENLSKAGIVPDKINDNNRCRRYFVGLNDYVDNRIVEKAYPNTDGKIKVKIYHPVAL